MKGKDKCRMLKQIRKKIADENDIPYVVEECPYQGECKGTCPKCEAELREMERQLSLRRKLGKGVAIAGIASGIMMSTVACTPQDVVDFVENVFAGERLDGDVVVGGIAETIDDYQELMGTPTPCPQDYNKSEGGTTVGDVSIEQMEEYNDACNEGGTQ